MQMSGVGRVAPGARTEAASSNSRYDARRPRAASATPRRSPVAQIERAAHARRIVLCVTMTPPELRSRPAENRSPPETD